MKPEQFLFPSRVSESPHLSTRQYSRIVQSWVAAMDWTPRPMERIRFAARRQHWSIGGRGTCGPFDFRAGHDRRTWRSLTGHKQPYGKAIDTGRPMALLIRSPSLAPL